MSTIVEEIKKAILTNIHFGLYQGRVCQWKGHQATILLFALKEGIITRTELEKVVHSQLLAFGRANYTEHIRGTYPDHVSSPVALVYALRNSEFTAKEEGAIQFDHGETKFNFMEEKAKRLLDDVVAQLLDVTR